MVRDRFLNFLLTVIALELLWIAVGQSWPSVQAAASEQPAAGAHRTTAVTAPTPVIITGFRLDPSDPMLPVQVMGIVSVQQSGPVKVEADHPLPVAPVPNPLTKFPGQ